VCSSLIITRVLKSRMLILVGHEAHVLEIGNTNLKLRDHLEELSVVRRVVSKWMLGN
jgi:hypothetical protein